MQWLNPAAWAGLLLLAVPIVAHLFSRRPPRVVAFPTLRFVQATTLRPTRRSVITDRLLLLLRLLIIAAAVTALAQPRWNRGDPHSGTLSTVLIRDTTWGSTAASIPVPVASTAAVSDADSAYRTLQLHARAATLRSSIDQAVNWLRTRPAPRKLVVQSTFPSSAIDSLTIVALPSDLLVELDALPRPSAARDTANVLRSHIPRDTILWTTGLTAREADDVVNTVFARGGATVRWNPSTAGTPVDDGMPDRPHAELHTAQTPALPALDTSAAGTVQDVTRLMTIARDPGLRALTAAEVVGTTPALAQSGSAAPVPLLFDAGGRTAVAGGVRNGHPMVISYIRERPSVAVAALLALSQNPVIDASRLLDGIDTTRQDSAVLERWEVLPAAPPIGAGASDDLHATTSHARWIWLLVAILMVIEWAFRRSVTSRAS